MHHDAMGETSGMVRYDLVLIYPKQQWIPSSPSPG
jgi:hypothetical protein